MGQIFTILFYLALITLSIVGIMKAIDTQNKESGTAWLLVLMLAIKIVNNL